MEKNKTGKGNREWEHCLKIEWVVWVFAEKMIFKKISNK